MFTKADIQILLDGPEIYRPNDLVRGIILIKAIKDFTIRSIQLDFKGILRTMFVQHVQETYTVVIDNIVQTRTRTVSITHEERHELFSKTLELAVSLDKESLSKNQEKRYSFELTFPESVNCRTCGSSTTLPPSIPIVGGSNFSVHSSYTLSASLQPDSSFGSCSQSLSLKFKPEGNSKMALAIDNGIYSYKQLLEWKSKLKPLLDENYHSYGDSDEVKNEKEELKKKMHTKSISNPLHSTHRHTRSIRKLFNSHYKMEKYKKLVGDVNLEVEVLARDKIIDSVDNLGTKFELILRSKIEDLQPNYLLYCNESSQLGCFAIVNFKLSIKTRMSVVVKGLRGTFSRNNEIFNTAYGYELAFDIVNFVPSIDNPSLKEWHVSMDKIFNNKLINLITAEIGPTYNSNCNVLNITHSLCMELSIAPNLDEDAKVAKFFYDICLT